MKPIIDVIRATRHPWTRERGWDLMTLEVADSAALEVLIRRAYSKFWMPWWQQLGKAVLIKPSGAMDSWLAPSHAGTNREHCLAIAVGDEVWTDFAGQITRHKVIERDATRCASQTGVSLKVTPKVPKSTATDDIGDREFRGIPWIDCAWFRRVELAHPGGAAAEGGACRVCQGEMAPGVAIEQSLVGHPDFPGDKHAVTVSPGGPGRIVDCMKCTACGWSVTGGVEI